MRAVATAAALLIVGCATTTMDGIMQSWEGQHVDQVVKRWGFPSAERTFRGRTLYVWNDSGQYIVPQFGSAQATRTGPGSATVTSTSIGGGTISGACERILEVDPAGKVIGWQWGGNDCCVAEIAGRCAQWRNPAKP